MDATGSKTALCDLKSFALTQYHVGLWHAHIIKDNLSVIMLFAKDSQGPEDLDTWRITWYQNHRLLCMHWTCETGLAQKDKDFALRPDGAGDPPLVPIDHVVISICINAAADISCVT